LILFLIFVPEETAPKADKDIQIYWSNGARVVIKVLAILKIKTIKSIDLTVCVAM